MQSAVVLHQYSVRSSLLNLALIVNRDDSTLLDCKLFTNRISSLTMILLAYEQHVCEQIGETNSTKRIKILSIFTENNANRQSWRRESFTEDKTDRNYCHDDVGLTQCSNSIAFSVELDRFNISNTSCTKLFTICPKVMSISQK